MELLRMHQHLRQSRGQPRAASCESPEGAGPSLMATNEDLSAQRGLLALTLNPLAEGLFYWGWGCLR